MKLMRICSLLVVLVTVIGCAQPTAVPTVPPPAATTAPVAAAPAATKPPATTAPVAAAPTAALPAATAAPTIGPTRPAATQAPTAILPAQPSNCIKFGSGGTLGQNATLDTSILIGGEPGTMTNAVYERLTDMDSDFKLSPALAVSWESNANSTEWTYHLRQGVKFHDGHEMTSKDVVWTFQRLISPTVGSEAMAILSSFLKPEGIIAVDKYTVMFKVDKPVAQLDLQVAIKNGLIVPYGAQKDDLKFSGNGTGPWVPVDYKPGESPHKLVAFKDYWNKGFPKAECAEVYMIAEEATRLAGIQSGQLDITGISYALVQTVKKNPEVTVQVAQSGGFETFSMWVDTKPFDDNRVRQALKMVIDRQAMVDTLLLGYGEVGDDNPIPPTSPDAFRSAPPPRDVAGAKKLLAEAGYGPSNPLKVDLYTAVYGTAFVPKSEMFRQQAAEAGIIVNVIVGPTSEYWSNVWLKQPFVNSTWILRPPAEALALLYRTNSTNNETHFKRPEFDALLDKASLEMDAVKRRQVYQQAEKMLAEEGGVIVPFFTRGVTVVRANCTGFVQHISVFYTSLAGVSCKR